jgi:hypothetical protein
VPRKNYPPPFYDLSQKIIVNPIQDKTNIGSASWPLIRGDTGTRH